MNTVFVIGAGASKEAGLPTGDDLKKKIAHLLDIRFDMFGHRQESGDTTIKDALQLIVQHDHMHPGKINTYLHEAWHIRDALPQALSIDNFIDSQSGNEKLSICGKLAIIRSILEAEKDSKLYCIKDERNKYDFTNLEKTWYECFFQILCENCSIKSLEKRLSEIALIIFNYDRCVEHFIYHALQNYYKISETQATELVRKIKIYHPYGISGSLPWLNTSQTSMDYGGEPNPQELIDLSQKIKTFTEGTDPNSSDIDEIKNHMIRADKIIFIGFAFHKLNMQLLRPRSFPSDKNIRIFASAFGISESDINTIKDQIYESYLPTKVDVNIVNKNCYNMFKEYWKSISIA